MWRGVLTTLMFAAGVGPEQARSNISHWFDVLGMEDVSAALVPLSIDTTLIISCSVLLAASFLPQLQLAFLGGDKRKREREKPTQAQHFYRLWNRADSFISRVRHQRGLDWWERQRRSGFNKEESIIDIANDGMSLLLHYEKHGLPVPKFETNSAEKVVVGLEAYFSDLAALLRDGHVETVLNSAHDAAAHAERVALNFNPQHWYRDA